ncbi:MAG: hypothetical protein JXE06_05880 [Coriobacteriia bacterium]|nr:hypothetical protein [Coriobacteriia bacterium]MBN2823034.1 hypothetical protein [Coriobacteriia bacterium]
MANAESRDFDLPALLPAEFYCLDCAEKLCGAARGIEGVLRSSCDKESGVLTVSFNPGRIDASALEKEIVRLGMNVVGAVGHAAYRLEGLD